MNFNFGEVLTRAWQIVWKFKVLWIFGILAGCSRGGALGSSGWSQGQGYRFSSPETSEQAQRLYETIAANASRYITILVVTLLLIWIIVTFFSIIGKIGLIRGVAQTDGGAEKLIFGQLFSESTPYFWRMFGLSLIIAVPILILSAIMFTGALAFFVPVSVSSGSGISETPRIGLMALVPFLIGCCTCLLVPFVLVAGLVVRQAENAIVLEDMRVFQALARGWEVFRKNLGPIFLMAIILWVIGAVIGLIVAIPVMLVVFPAMFAFIAGGARSFIPMILLGVCLCLYVPISMILNGILISYTESSWTLTYIRLTQTPKSDNLIPEDVHPIIPEIPDTDKTIIARPNA